jgi:hypothetical protein
MADYELARTFHPDAPAAQALPATVRHARFHAVTRAYDILRGKPHPFGADDDGTELGRRSRQHAQRQAYYRRRAAADFAEAVGVGEAGEAWKDQVIIIVGLAVRISSFFLRGLLTHGGRPLRWASCLHCCRYTRFLTRGIALRLRTWRRLVRMHGHLETNDVPLFVRA